MFSLWRPHHSANNLTSRLNRASVWPAAASKRRLVRRSTLLLQELEDRVVPTLLGQQLFPLDNPWNQNISDAPVAANSAAIITHIGASTPLHPDWGADNPANGDDPLYGIPVNIVHGNSIAKVNVIIDNYPGESDIDPVPIPANAVLEGDYQDGPNPNGGGYNPGQRGDSHLIIWDEDTNTAYELFGVTRPSDPTLFPNTNGVELPQTDGLWHAAQETVWNMNNDTFRTLGETSADAAGLSILAGLARPDEGLPVSQGGQGAIDHALRFTLPSSDVNPQYVYPASHIVNVSQEADNLPFGGRLRLANTPAINALINDMPPESQILARAMQQFGLILADIGSAMYVTGTSATIDDVDSPNLDQTWNLNDIFASNGLEVLNAGDFQVVNLTPVVTGLSETSGTAGSTITITGQNFSGAAGHLSVFFGSTAASSVTYVSDSEITAIVPTGVGTVNVTVQSGVNETDNISSNPDANVNAPIFGYGISAVTTADQFTYGAQTISPTGSEVSFASPTDVSGETDLLTIVVENTNGNAVSGLGSSAFSFSLAGGSSAGTFSAVTPTATAGTYTAVFTGSTAGTASTLTVRINGVALSTQPTVQVRAGSVSATTSTASFASPTVTSGGTDLLTLLIKDAAGNAITGLASSAFSFALAGGKSAGKFGSVSATTTPGTYTVVFTGTKVGTASTLTAKVSGVKLNSKPTVQVVAGGVSGTKSAIRFATSTVASSSTDVITIAVKNKNGNPITGLSLSTFRFALAGGKSAGEFGTVSATTTAGTYTVVFTGTTPGTASRLTATVRDVRLNAKPKVRVVAGAISGARSASRFRTLTDSSGSTNLMTPSG
jgi:IPT/TIG domain/Invasin, domain 3